jgi:Na+/melibiose symporter-like transporter
LADEQVREVDFTHGANVIAKSTSTVRHRPFTPVDYTRWLQRTVRMPTERRVSSATALYCALGGGVLVLVAVAVGISAFSSGQGGHQAGQSAVLVVALAVIGIVLLVVAAVMAVPRAVETAIGVGFSLATVRNLNSHRFGNAALNATAAEALHARSVERDAAQAY